MLELFHFLKNVRINHFFQKQHCNFPFEQPSTSCLSCPVPTLHHGQRREKTPAADRTEMKHLKVKHDNCTKRPHILGTSTRDKRKRRTLPCGSVWTNLKGNWQGLMTLTRERHQKRNAHNCWFHLPWPANPEQDRHINNYKRTVQDAGWNPQVRTYKLRLGKGLPLCVLTSYFLQFNWYGSRMIKIQKRYQYLKTFEKQLQMIIIRNSSEPSRTISPYPWEMVLHRPKPFSAISKL